MTLVCSRRGPDPRVIVRWLSCGACVLVTSTVSLAQAQTTAARVDTSPEAASIAIMPFANLSRDPADDWIGEGITQTVSADLTKVGLTLVEQTAVLGALGTRDAVDPERVDDTRALEIGRQLGATLLVRGTYQRVGDQLRITAHVVDVRSGDVVQSTKVDGMLSDLFAAQDQVGAALAERIAPGPDRATGSLRLAPVPPARERRAVAPERTPLPAEVARVIEGPAPPLPPDVIARDDQGRVTIRAVRVTDLQLDGQLDEPIYSSIGSISGFIQNIPDVGQPGSQRTEAWVFFDDDNVYVAARCWDTAPESDWVANEMRRDSGGIQQNDNFGVIFDTFYDRRSGVMFYTNPLGGMRDIQITNEGNANIDWNTVWEVRTSRFDGGWSVEMQFPFKSLRYRPGGQQVWGVQLRRSIRRRNEFAYITAMPPQLGSGAWTRVSMAATLVGLEVPASSRNLEIKPYGISGVRTDRTGSSPVSNDLSGDVGLDVKYGVTQSVTLDLTYNTDFAQVEVDERQINLTRFNLFFPEKREFFLEGRGLFEFSRGAGSRGGLTPNLFFSRRIGLNAGGVVPIIAGGRLTGRVGRLSIGALNIQTDEEPVSQAATTNFTVVRLRQDILRRSSVGLMYTGRSASVEVPDVSNHAYGVDAAFAFYENVSLSGYLARTQTSGLAGRDTSYQANFNYSPDWHGVRAEHLFVGDAFNPEVGFVRRDDMRRTFVSGRFSPRLVSNPTVRRFVWEASIEYIENTAGLLETRQQALRFSTEFQNSDRINVDANRRFEYLVRPFEVSDGVTIPVGGYDSDSVRASYTIGQQRRISGRLSFEHGGFFDGDQTGISFEQGRLEITPQFSIEPSVSINWIDLPHGTFTTRLYRTRTTYTFTPRMFVSSLLQYNSSSDTLSTNLRLRWEYSPGSELFVVYTEDRGTDIFMLMPRFADLRNRAFVVKFNHLFRL